MLSEGGSFDSYEPWVSKSVKRYDFGATNAPGVVLMMGARDDCERTPQGTQVFRIWIRRWAADGTEVDEDLGLVFPAKLPVLGIFLETMLLQVDEVGDFQDEVRRRLELNHGEADGTENKASA